MKMLPTKSGKSNLSPKPTTKDPTLSSNLPSTSKSTKTNLDRIKVDKGNVSFRKKCCKFLYNKQNKTFCGRTCLSWACIIAYSIMYLIFLCTYTIFFLYVALSIVKVTVDFKVMDLVEPLTYPEYKIGLTATPTSDSHQIISYRMHHKEDYEKYVRSIDNLLRGRKRESLGPCGVSPYGYGAEPCIILRINRHLLWSGKPLEANSTKTEMLPLEVKEWIKRDKKFWLHCSGYHSYDKEHVGRIRYYPDPPGFDPDLFPPAPDRENHVIGIQLSGFTLDVSLAIECKLYYERGPSTTDFIIYVSGDRNNKSLI